MKLKHGQTFTYEGDEYMVDLVDPVKTRVRKVENENFFWMLDTAVVEYIVELDK